ncbi:hypothetical protein N7540_004156 [Penicillium herquei]|nr:hypothetical protein N7540_004156 [Penicillium herquei]
MTVTKITTVAEFTAAIETKERVLISFTLEDSKNPQNDSCEAVNPLFEELSGSNNTVKFYQVIINKTPDVSQKADVDMMLLPSYKLYKDGKGPVKVAQGPNPRDLFDLLAAA